MVSITITSRTTCHERPEAETARGAFAAARSFAARSGQAGGTVAGRDREDGRSSGRPGGACVGDCFAKSAATPARTLHIEGGSDKFDNVGAEHAGGEIIVEGDVGAYAGTAHEIRTARHPRQRRRLPGFESARRHRVVRGSAGAQLGAPLPGEKDGMAGGDGRRQRRRRGLRR